MIKSIELINFQAHIKTRLDLNPGLNVITGSSDNGKSSVLRALTWIADNRPIGEAIMNWFMSKDDSTTVRVELDENILIERSKGKENHYKLVSRPKLRKRNSPPSTQEFNAFKQDVPEEVRSAFNLSDVNIQSQHKPYFMIDDSPGDVARQFNALAGLDIIDKMFKNLNSFILEDRRTVDHCAASIKDLEKKIEDLAYIDQAKLDIQEVWDLDYEIKVILREQRQLVKAEQDIDSIEVAMEKDAIILSMENDIAQMISNIQSIRQVSTLLKKLNTDLSNINHWEQELAEEKEWLKIEPDLDQIKSAIVEIEKTKRNTNELKQDLLRLDDIERKMKQSEKNVADRTEQYKQLLLKTKTCPVCGATMTEHCIKKLIS